MLHMKSQLVQVLSKIIHSLSKNLLNNGEMGQVLPKALANGSLMCTSFWCLKKCDKTFRYARASFKLYFLVSALTLFNLFYQSPFLKKWEKVTLVWAYALGLPLLATDLSISSPNVPDVSPLHLIVPVSTVLIYHSLPHKVDSILLVISHTISVLFLAANAIFVGISGFALSFVHLVSMFRFHGGTDAHTTWAFSMSLSNLLALDVIKFYM